MGAGRARHGHLRGSKSKQGRLKPKKSFNVLAHKATDNDETPDQIEATHSLLLASLRFWEVERDLIEERKAAIGR